MPSKFNIPFSIYAAFSLIIGITLAHIAHCYHLNPPCGALIILTIITILVVYYPLNKKQWLLISLLPLCTLTGAWRYAYLKSNHTYLLDTTTQKPVDLTGIVTDIVPVEIRSAHKITMLVQDIKSTDFCDLEVGRFILNIYTGKSHHICTGDTITINSILLKKNRADFTQYLLKEGVACSVFLNAAQCKIVSRPSFSLYRYITNLRTRLLNAMAKKLSTPTYTLFASLFLGNNKTNQYAMDSWLQLFRGWGLSHYLARSGLHLVLFVAIWLFILRITPIALAIKQFLLLLLIIMYSLISWPSVSFYRALYTFILCSLCIIRKKPIHYLHVLATVCIITLLYNPFYLLFLDFQLSYGLTFALGWFNYLSNRRTKIA